MALTEDLQKEVATIFKSVWKRRDGTVVPSDDSIKLVRCAVDTSTEIRESRAHDLVPSQAHKTKCLEPANAAATDQES
jgi:hypothetical protein